MSNGRGWQKVLFEAQFYGIRHPKRSGCGRKAIHSATQASRGG